MSNGKSVKDMLKEGANADALIEGLKKEIAEAQKELDKEKKEVSTNLDDSRTEAVAAVFNYLEELGVIDLSNESDDEIETLLSAAEDTLKEMEPEIKKYAKIINILLEVDDKEEMVQPFKAYVPHSLTKYKGGSFSADVDIDAKLADLLKKIM